MRRTARKIHVSCRATGDAPQQTTRILRRRSSLQFELLELPRLGLSLLHTREDGEMKTPARSHSRLATCRTFLRKESSPESLRQPGIGVDAPAPTLELVEKRLLIAR
jgi:hypothetical protein